MRQVLRAVSSCFQHSDRPPRTGPNRLGGVLYAAIRHDAASG